MGLQQSPEGRMEQRLGDTEDPYEGYDEATIERAKQHGMTPAELLALERKEGLRSEDSEEGE